LGTDRETISDDVLAAASEGLRRCGVEVGSVGGEDYRRHIARAALLAAVPHIEAAIRQRIAAEILAAARQTTYRAVNGKMYRSPSFDYLAAAAVARGGSR
jgi:hypothetical protein